MADSLYGLKQASKTKAKDISSSTSLAFSSSLASLISSSSKDKSSLGRSRPPKTKSDIFTAHNKNVKKRSANDMLDNGEQKHQTREDIGSVEAAELQRSKWKMEEKVRLYNAMKRGEYVSKGDGHDGSALVDFDRKWAESQGKGVKDNENESDSEYALSGEEEIVEYTDEFGRLRKGTKAQAAREERLKKIQANASTEAETFSARPRAPDSLIYGDAVQHNAFNPDQVVADRMADLAKKRDKSTTPPPDTHFDANAEVRTRGTGFYAFSHDSEQRKKEMDALEKERLETERVRKEKEDKREKRKQELEERKKAIAEQRSKAQADKFLNELEIEGD